VQQINQKMSCIQNVAFDNFFRHAGLLVYALLKSDSVALSWMLELLSADWLMPVMFQFLF